MKKASPAAVSEPLPSYMPFKVQYVVNGKGQKTHVQIDLKTFERIVDDLEMLEDIRAYDAAKAEGGEPVPFDLGNPLTASVAEEAKAHPAIAM